jgi:hypothetical protein
MKAKPKTIDEYLAGKRAIRLPAAKPLPVALVKKLVRARIEENEIAQLSRKSRIRTSAESKEKPR